MGFYDAKGYWRQEGDAFYDGKGYLRQPGEAFYDARGCLREPGDAFYDTRGQLRRPGDAYYDGTGQIRVPDNHSASTALCIAALFFPVGVLWMAASTLVDLFARYVYLVFIAYLLLSVVISLCIARWRYRGGGNVALSFIGSFLELLSFFFMVAGHAVPYMLENNGDFGGFFEFVATLGVSIAVIAILQFFNSYHEKAFLELFIGILLFVIVLLLLRSTLENTSVEELAKLYGLRVNLPFRLLFGILF